MAALGPDRVKVRKVGDMLTLSLPSSKSAFSQPFKEKYMSDVVRISSVILFHLSKL